MSHSILDGTSSPDSVDRRVKDHLSTQRARLGALYGTPAASRLSPTRSRLPVPTSPTRDLSPDTLARERSILADARALRHELRLKDTMVTDLRSTVSSLQQRLAESESHRRRSRETTDRAVHMLEERVSELVARGESSERETRVVKDKYESAVAQLEQRTSQVRHMEHEIDSLRRNVAELQSALDTRSADEDRIASLAGDLARTRVMVGELESALDRERRKVRDLGEAGDRCERAEAHLADERDRNRSLGEKVASLESRLSKALAEISEAEAEAESRVRTIASALDEARAENREIKRELDDVREGREAEVRERLQAVACCERMRAEMEEARAASRELGTRCERLADEVRRHQEQNGALTERLHAMERRHGEEMHAITFFLSGADGCIKTLSSLAAETTSIDAIIDDTRAVCDGGIRRAFGAPVPSATSAVGDPEGDDSSTAGCVVPPHVPAVPNAVPSSLAPVLASLRCHIVSASGNCARASEGHRRAVEGARNAAMEAAWAREAGKRVTAEREATRKEADEARALVVKQREEAEALDDRMRQASSRAADAVDALGDASRLIKRVEGALVELIEADGESIDTETIPGVSTASAAEDVEPVVYLDRARHTIPRLLREATDRRRALSQHLANLTTECDRLRDRSRDATASVDRLSLRHEELLATFRTEAERSAAEQRSRWEREALEREEKNARDMEKMGREVEGLEGRVREVEDRLREAEGERDAARKHLCAELSRARALEETARLLARALVPSMRRCAELVSQKKYLTLRVTQAQREQAEAVDLMKALRGTLGDPRQAPRDVREKARRQRAVGSLRAAAVLVLAALRFARGKNYYGGRQGVLGSSPSFAFSFGNAAGNPPRETSSAPQQQRGSTLAGCGVNDGPLRSADLYRALGIPDGGHGCCGSSGTNARKESLECNGGNSAGGAAPLRPADAGRLGQVLALVAPGCGDVLGRGYYVDAPPLMGRTLVEFLRQGVPCLPTEDEPGPISLIRTTALSLASRLQASEESRKRTEADLESTKVRASKLGADCEASEASLVGALETVDSLERAVAEMSDQINSMVAPGVHRGVLDQLREANRNEETLGNTVRQLRASLATHEPRIAELTSQLDAARERLFRAEAERDEARAEAERVETAMRGLEADLRVTRADLSETRGQLTSVSAESGSLRVAAQRATAAQASSAEQAQALSRRVENLSQRSASLSESLETSERRVLELSEIVGRLESQLDASKAREKSLAARLRQMSVSRDRALSAAMVVEKELADVVGSDADSPPPRHRQHVNNNNNNNNNNSHNNNNQRQGASSIYREDTSHQTHTVRETGSKLSRALRRNLDEEQLAE